MLETAWIVIKTDRVMEIGKYIDMHDNSSLTDNDARFSLNSDNVTLSTIIMHLITKLD
jgi:hypothetical protein